MAFTISVRPTIHEISEITIKLRDILLNSSRLTLTTGCASATIWALMYFKIFVNSTFTCWSVIGQLKKISYRGCSSLPIFVVRIIYCRTKWSTRRELWWAKVSITSGISISTTQSDLIYLSRWRVPPPPLSPQNRPFPDLTAFNLLNLKIIPRIWVQKSLPRLCCRLTMLGNWTWVAMQGSVAVVDLYYVTLSFMGVVVGINVNVACLLKLLIDVGRVARELSIVLFVVASVI